MEPAGENNKEVEVQPVKEQVFSLDDKQIIEHLRTENLSLIDSIYKTCTETLHKEEERSRAIDAKGASTLAMIGVSLSLIFTLGGLLIEKITNIPLPCIGSPIPWLVTCYISTSVTLLIAAICTLLSIRARSDWRGLKDTDIFNEKMIEDGECAYKRYFITHMWKVYQNNYQVTEAKGAYLKVGQVLYLVALFQLLPIICIIGFYSMNKGGFV